MDHYTTLGVNRNASDDEIKLAYRKLAAQHHPDRGGDTQKFQEVQAAYDVLSDSQKRTQYDNPQPQGFQFEFNSGVPHGFEQFFSNSPFGDIFSQFGRRPQPAKNRTLNLQTEITLEEAFYGKDLIANIQLPSGRNQTVEVKIPAGARQGVVLRLAGMGDDSIPNLPRGDIHLTVNVQPHSVFRRENDDLIMDLKLSSIDAILGTTINVNCIDNKTMNIKIPRGIQHGQILNVAGQGMPNISNFNMKGRLLLVVQLTTPTNLSDEQYQILETKFKNV